MKYLLWFFSRLTVALVATACCIVLLQDFLIHPNLSHSFFAAKSRDPSSLPEGVEGFFFTTEEEVTLEGWHLPPKVEPRGVAIIFHGNGETVESAFGHQLWMQSLGLASFSYDYRGYGKSSGWPSEEGFYADIRALKREIEKRYDLDALPVVTLGNSLGTGLSAYFGTLHQVEVAMLVAPYSSLREVAASRPVIGVLAPFLWYEIPTLQYLLEGNPSCILLAHGKRDRVIPFENSEKLVRSLSKHPKLFTYFSASHHFNVWSRELIEQLDEQLQLCLQGTKT